jgi:hypothetical protein
MTIFAWFPVRLGRNLAAGIILRALAVLAVATLGAACAQPSPPTQPTAGHPTTVYAAAPTRPRAKSTSPATSGLLPGPNSKFAAIDLPVGAVLLMTVNPQEKEDWMSSTSYDETVTFFRKQFATNSKYDSNGATWWGFLPPCYNDQHKSPPLGWAGDQMTEWAWGDSALALDVKVYAPQNSIVGDPEVTIAYVRAAEVPAVCNRN